MEKRPDFEYLDSLARIEENFVLIYYTIINSDHLYSFQTKGLTKKLEAMKRALEYPPIGLSQIDNERRMYLLNQTDELLGRLSD